MQTVLPFLNLSAFLFLGGSNFRIDRLGGWDKVSDEGEIDIDSLCGLGTSLSISLMDYVLSISSFSIAGVRFSKS